ncbi:hypothetical protein Tco_1442782, partial [Tanacetum coccineum]
MRTNHQNFSNSRRNFTPTAVLTKSGKVLISTARQSSSRAAVPVSAARPINTAALKSFVNVAKLRTNSLQKTHSSSRRPFYHQTTLKNRNLKNKVNTVKINSVNTAETKGVKSAVEKQGINAVKPSACWVWRPKSNVIDHISKTSGSYICKSFNYGDPQVALKDTGIFDSKCSRHMTGNKSYLTDYQDHDGGFVAFAGSSKGRLFELALRVNMLYSFFILLDLVDIAGYHFVLLVQKFILLALAIPGQTTTGKEFSNPLMAGFCDKHNMVAFLQKPAGSEEFHEIAYFLVRSHIWEQQITVTVDEHNFAITKVFVRRHLQLADVDGISSMPNTEIFENLSRM